MKEFYEYHAYVVRTIFGLKFFDSEIDEVMQEGWKLVGVQTYYFGLFNIAIFTKEVPR